MSHHTPLLAWSCAVHRRWYTWSISNIRVNLEAVAVEEVVVLVLQLAVVVAVVVAVGRGSSR